MNWTRIIQLEMTDCISFQVDFITEINQAHYAEHMINQIIYEQLFV